jgi:FixJ family two-component response regulator/signal transduction histidine kinase
MVALVEDDAIVALGLRETFEARGFAVKDYPSAEAFLADLVPDRFGCLVLDAMLPGMGGLDLLDRLRRDGHRLPVIMCTGAGDIRMAVAAMKAGAADFIQKPVNADQILDAVARCMTHPDDHDQTRARRAAAAKRIEGLTERQRQIMDRVLDGQPNKNIAADLGLSQRTVENHRAKLMRRTGVASLPELARLALTASPLTDGADAPALPDRAAPPPATPADDDQFRRYFDAVPIAIVISTIASPETIVYANPAFATLTGQDPSLIVGQPWTHLQGADLAMPGRLLGAALVEASDWVGTFELAAGDAPPIIADAYANVISDEGDQPANRLVVLVQANRSAAVDPAALAETIREKDMMIREIQHRVKNNLQMITSLIRLEAQGRAKTPEVNPLDRLEGRINAIQIIYKLLSDFSQSDEIDLGTYLSEIAAAVMHAHAVEGIRLDLKVDAYPVSVNVALPTGLVANELLTNALRHAFVGRDGGTITLHSLTDDTGCRVTVADDGIGLPPGMTWPSHGKLGELMVRSLRQNAKADFVVSSAPDQGTRSTIAFSRAAAQA